MDLANDRENRLMRLQCIKENVTNILLEHRMLGQQYTRITQPQSPLEVLNALDIGIRMDQMRMRVFQIILNVFPEMTSSDEELRVVFEMVDLLVAASNEYNTMRLGFHHRLYGHITLIDSTNVTPTATLSERLAWTVISSLNSIRNYLLSQSAQNWQIENAKDLHKQSGRTGPIQYELTKRGQDETAEELAASRGQNRLPSQTPKRA